MNTRFIGKVYLRFDELPSTNDYALALLDVPAFSPILSWTDVDGIAYAMISSNNKPVEGTVIRAASQSAGRGQFGSHWQSTPGQNLLLSVIFYPNWLEVSAQFHLSMAVALALRDAVEGRGWRVEGGGHAPHSSLLTPHSPPLTPHPSLLTPHPSLLSPHSSLKWPNDLYFGAQKAAGILIQNALSGSRLQSSVVGIGLNVNQLEFDPALPNPTSLAAVFEKTFDLDALAERLLECLEHRYEQLRSGHRAALKSEYERSLLGFGEIARYARPDRSAFEGIVRGVTQEGRLRMEMADGREQTFGLKEVSPIF